MTVAPAPSEFETGAGDDQIYQDIHDTASRVESYAISIREAAFRGDRIYLRIYRADFRREVSLLLGLIGDLAALEGEATEAKRNGRARQ
jgi:hypothetical protein